MCRARILAVDDEENFLRLLTHTLLKEGYEITTVANGQEALQAFEQGPFDVALLDIKMPLMDGVAIMRRIRAFHPKTKVIMITAYPSNETRTVCLDEGAYSYLVKPVEIDYLKQTIRMALSQLDSDGRHH